MRRRELATAPLLAAALTLVGAGCGGDEDGGAASKDCGAAPTALAAPPALPGAFPTAAGVTYTGSRKDGPSTIVEGYRPGDVAGGFDAYETAVKGASGWSVTKDEKEDFDAEVNFAGHAQSGQVKLKQSCKDRTSVTITFRPD
jgi:hypothetical protein